MNKFASQQRLECVVCRRVMNSHGHCPEPIECSYEARLRLGMPPWQARKARGAEYAERKVSRRRAA
jgi:hypothetical protein